MHIESDDYRSDELEIDLFLEGVYRKYGYDFRQYSRASLKRRIFGQVDRLGVDNVCALLHKVLYDQHSFISVLEYMTVNVTEMFRDPKFYTAFREKVVPVLKTFPSAKIWHAGCSTGEEVYSMCILLKEEGIYDRCQIYATDIDKKVLDKAKKGIFPIEAVKHYSDNYNKSGGHYTLSKYYTARYDGVIMDNSLKKNIVFADHDLATDQVFGEMQVILCRNVLIYFNRGLQNRVFNLFTESLDHHGFLCLGSKESLRYAECNEYYEEFDKDQKIYHKTTN